MKKTSKIAILVVIGAILLLGIGYAALQNITLNIGGTVTADPSQANFDVKFTGTPSVSDEAKVTAGIADDLNATIEVEGLETNGEIVTATYEIVNASENLSADLTIETTNSNTEYFDITSELAKTNLEVEETTTVIVTVELIKQPIEEVEATVNVKIIAEPLQPGEDENLGDVSSESFGSFAKMVKEEPKIYYGMQTDYPLDIDNNTETNDWSVFYSDGENVFLIADECVLNSKLTNGEMSYREGNSYENYIDSVQLTTTTIDNTVKNKYLLKKYPGTECNSLKDKATAHLLNTDIWKSFVDINSNESTADDLAESAIGSPTLEMWIESWNEKYAYDKTTFSQMKCTYDIFQTGPETIFYGYYLARESEDFEYNSGHVSTPNGYDANESTKLYFLENESYRLASPFSYEESDLIACNNDRIYIDGYGSELGIRPVICLKQGVLATQDGEVLRLTTK